MKKTLILLLCLVVTGCATDLTNIKKDHLFDYQAGKSIIFGEVKFEEFDYKLYDSLYLNLVRFEDKRDFNIGITDSGYWERLFPKDRKASVYFFIELPPGKYMIKQVEMADWSLWWPGIYISVPQKPSLIYVGTLQVTQTDKKNLWSNSAFISIDILDKRSEAIKILKQRYPDIKQEIIFQIMKRRALAFEPKLESIEKLGQWQKEYGRGVIEKIKRRSYIYFGHLAEGEVVVDFSVRKSGGISKISVDEDRSIDNRDLRNLAIKAVERCAPFDIFPSEAEEKEAQFTIAIVFKLEDRSAEEKTKGQEEGKIGPIPVPIVP